MYIQKEDKLYHLSEDQKETMQKLMKLYHDNKSIFTYVGSARRENYAHTYKYKTTSELIPKDPNKRGNYENWRTSGCLKSNGTDYDYVLNCGLFAQMIWMGRDITDFTEHLGADAKNILKINPYKGFDWGYYFDFLSAKKIYRLEKEKDVLYKGLYYTKADDDGKSYSVTFDNAAAMAQELYNLGCEIPYADAEVGDLVFYRGEDLNDGNKDEIEARAFRNISHVAVVYDVTDGCVEVMECTTGYTSAIGKCTILSKDSNPFMRARAGFLGYRVAMCARHPAANPNFVSNVPASFTSYRCEYEKQTVNEDFLEEGEDSYDNMQEE